MLQTLSDQKRKELHPYVIFVGVGYWPDIESFALGMPTRSNVFVESVFSSGTLDSDVNRISALAPSHWVEIFFISHQKTRIQVTKDDAIWFLDNMEHY